MDFYNFQELTLDEDTRKAAEEGILCFLCLKTKFWMFCRGVCCSVCSHVVCRKCSHSVRIPSDQLQATHFFSLGGTDHHPLQDTGNSSRIATSRQHPDRNEEQTSLISVPTVSATMDSLPPCMWTETSLPPVKKTSLTLPRKTGRRWSMISARTRDKEKVEDCPLSVCTHCKPMAMQVMQL